MRKFTLFFTLLCMVLGVSAQTNLVQNPGFETWTAGKPDSWVVPANSAHATSVTLSQETTIKTEGASSMKLVIDANNNPGFQQVIPIVAGKNYVVSVDCYVVAGDATDTRIWCSFKNATGFYAAANWTTAVAADPNIQKTLQPNDYTVVANETWKTVTAKFKAPADATDFVFEFRTYKNATVIYDNASLVEDQSADVNNTKVMLNVFAANGKINFEAAEGETVEVYNTVGQKVLSAAAISGNNSLAVTAKGVVFVKVGNRTGKVIL